MQEHYFLGVVLLGVGHTADQFWGYTTAAMIPELNSLLWPHELNLGVARLLARTQRSDFECLKTAV